MDKYTCIVVDDEILFTEYVKSLIEKTKILKLIGTYNNPEEGLEAIVNDNPDIVFLDMHMPKLNGLDIVKSLPYKPEIIIVTSSPDFAVEAFAMHVTDYLIKPVESYARFLNSVERARKNLDVRYPNETRKRIFLKVDSSFVKIDPENLFYIQAYGDYIKVHTNNKVYTIKKKITEVEKKLPPGFLRVHRSYIVNIFHIENIEQNSLQINNKIIPVSNTYKQALMNAIELI